MNRNFLLALSLFVFLVLTSCNVQRDEKLCCGRKPDPAAIELHYQAINVHTNHSNSSDSVKKATTSFDYAIDKDPGYQFAYAYKAEYLKNQGGLIQALETLNVYLKRDSTEPYTLFGAGMFYERLRSKKEAVDYYERVEANSKGLYEKGNDSAHEINRYFVIRLMEGPKKAKVLYEAERDHLASTEEQRKVNDALVMSIIETPCEQFFGQTSLSGGQVNQLLVDGVK